MIDEPPEIKYTPENTHYKEGVFLPDLVKGNDAGAILEHKFLLCTILGPAVVHFASNCTFEPKSNTSLLPKEMTLWPSLTQSGYYAGIIHLVACRFVLCTFDGIAFYGNSSHLKWMMQWFQFPAST